MAEAMLCIRGDKVAAMVVVMDDDTYRDILAEWAVDATTQAILRVPVEVARKVFFEPAPAIIAAINALADTPSPQPNLRGVADE